jgi:hypothetical protein
MFSITYRLAKSQFRFISFQYFWFPRCVSGTIPAKHQDFKCRMQWGAGDGYPQHSTLSIPLVDLYLDPRGRGFSAGATA